MQIRDGGNQVGMEFNRMGFYSGPITRVTK